MDNEKRLFLAFALSMLVILAFSWNNAKNAPPRKPQTETQQNAAAPGPISSASPTATQSPAPNAPVNRTQDRTQSSQVANGWGWLETSSDSVDSGEVVVESERYQIRFSKQGASPVSWKLLSYPQLFSKKRYLKLEQQYGSPVDKEIAQLEIQLLEQTKQTEDEQQPVNAINPLFDAGRAGMVVRWGQDRFDRDVTYTCDAESVTVSGETEIVFRSVHQDIVLEKRYQFYPDSYKVDLEIRLINQSDQPLAFQQQAFYDINWQGGFGFTSLRTDAANNAHVQMGGSVTTTLHPALQKTFGVSGVSAPVFLGSQLAGYRNPTSLIPNDDGEQVGWVGVSQKYFLAAIINHTPTEAAIQGLISPTDDELRFNKPMMGVRMRMAPSLPAGASHIDRFTLYVGPKDVKDMAMADATLEDARQLFLFSSLTGPIASWMLWLLQSFYSLVPNYGVCIILLTLLIKLLMFPVMQKQMHSMRKMQALQPHINQLKEQHKDDAQKMQKEQMELFRKHKVNPLGGCLPIFITIPIFVALYSTFSLSVELRGAPFFGWITDLSQPDAAFYIPLASYIIDINILPIAYTLLMFISMSMQKMEGPNAAAMKIMPFVFVFIFWQIASGVILYFVISMLIDVIQRIIIEKTNKEDLLAPPPTEKKRSAARKKA
ncbi:MAG: YidC/Oxa1 family insertase periplasmic-domain containing protein [Candidatus Hinthialibacter antarcticus]|nr:YidC/Oxa1 family insertase periplasmic-domain containing protein [Candidatus Hinthialibacter antarcticus]